MDCRNVIRKLNYRIGVFFARLHLESKKKYTSWRQCLWKSNSICTFR